VNRQAQAVILLLLGGAILRASLSDLYLRYVKEGLRPFLIGAGIVLVTASIMTLWYDLRQRLDAVTEHDHGHHEPRVGWLLLLPVLGLLLVAPPAMGSFAAGQSGTALRNGQQSDFTPLPAGDPVEVTVLDYASRAVFDDGRSLTGREVTITGFVIPGASGEVYLARMMLACCAADARPIKVGLTGDAPGGLAADTWVRATGRYTPRRANDTVNGETIPFLDVTSWQQVDTPKNTYES